MALPPTIPTSFVPKQPVVPRSAHTGFNPFLFASYIIFTVWVIVAALLFGYQWYLTRQSEAKTAEVTTAQNSIDEASVTQFIRLRNRFTVAQQTLDKHITLSKLFDRLEAITIQNVSITNLKVTVQENRTAKLEMKGVAKNFNALAAQSSAFAADPDIRSAIFSGFSLDSTNGTVTFQVNADVNASLLTQSPAEAGPPADNTMAQPAPVQPTSTTTP